VENDFEKEEMKEPIHFLHFFTNSNEHVSKLKE
jgi:hypothetical protein